MFSLKKQKKSWIKLCKISLKDLDGNFICHSRFSQNPFDFKFGLVIDYLRLYSKFQNIHMQILQEEFFFNSIPCVYQL